MIYDAVIVGKGPAGITCAIYLKRYGYNVLVIGKDGGALEGASLIENYYGIKQISGKDLVKFGIEQAISLGIEVLTDEVINIDKEVNFKVTTARGLYEGKTLVLACGTSRNRYPLADKYEGVSYCATCDGFFYRKKRIALIGNSLYMLHELEVLANMCKDITVFTDGLELEVKLPEGVKVVSDKIINVDGDTHIKAIVTKSGRYEIDGCFIARGKASGFTLAKHLGLGLSDNALRVDDKLMTNISGLFACGDVTGGLLQVSKAVGEGANCAKSISDYLKNK